MNKISLILSLIVVSMLVGCGPQQDTRTSDEKQHDAQEAILQEGTAQTGMPAIKNFRERKMLKQILELRDQSNYVTYTYIENQYPKAIHNITALGGKFTFLGTSVGYPIPYSTEYTSPMKYEYGVVPQADPNGLFSPASSEATWVAVKSPNGDVVPVYCEPKLLTLPYKLASD